MTPITGTAILEIVKGVGKVPQDSTSAEQALDSINLLDPAGFAASDYDIQLPNMKSSAVYADSPLTDGRTLISGVLGNVTETIRLELVSSTIIQMAALLSKLARFRQDCNDFWDTFNQIEPVYLKHQVIGESGPRYALLYNIDINVDTPIEPGTPQRTVTLSIEREYGWRSEVNPGGNPKQYTYKVNNLPFNSSVAALTSGLYIASGTLRNCNEYNPSGINPANKMYIDIPAASIPGDLPAKVFFSAVQSTIAHSVYFVARSTKRSQEIVTANGGYEPNHDLTAVTGFQGTDTSQTNDTGGCLDANIAATRKRSETTFAGTATNALRLSWTNATLRGPVGTNLNRGRYMIFIRARQHNGTFGDIKMSVAFWNYSTVNQFTTPEQSPTVQSGTGNTTGWPVTYMGTVDIPIANRSANSSNGRGLLSPTSSAGELLVGLYARRTTGTGVLYTCDIILIPIDEVCVKLSNSQSISPRAVIYDNTGHMAHGMPSDTTYFTDGAFDSTSFTYSLPIGDITGGSLTLLPGVSNRLFIFAMTADNLSQTQVDHTFGLHIIPHWSGLRAV